ncbi:hypothetical protein [Pontibacter pudoricolor]|nr:hypothetical protein [Pontibacter pudoricolor]
MKDLSLWVERLVNIWCRKALRRRSKRDSRSAMPEDGPPGREGTKAGLKR